MSNWLNPVTDYLNAAKSGSDVGLALARIQNDKSESAAKLARAAQAEENQNALGYATLNARQQEAQQSAAEKLQAAMAQQADLNDWRRSKLEQSNQSLGIKSAAADSLIDTRSRKLDMTGDRYATLEEQGNRKLDQTDEKISQSQQRIDDRAANNAIINSLKQQALELAKSKSITPGDKAVLQGATHSLWSAQSALANPLMPTTSPAYTNVLNQINDAKKVIQSFRQPAAASAADALAPTAAMTSPAAETGSPFSGINVTSPSSNAGLFAPSAADALTSGTTTGALPAATAPEAKVRVKSPDGTIGTIPASQLDDAIANGYEQVQ